MSKGAKGIKRIDGYNKECIFVRKSIYIKKSQEIKLIKYATANNCNVAFLIREIFDVFFTDVETKKNL